ncbi:MAG: OmpA family protein [Proteobacteria bacterium]|nr:OmpA family protein [Pseudomonadota bacterium]
MRSRMVPIVAGLFAVVATQAFAQNPSADQIIKSLTPSGDVSKQGTRGIRLSTGDGSGAAAAPAAPAPSAGAARKPSHGAMASSKPMAPTEASGPSVDLTVNFETASADLTADAMKTLDELGAALSSDALKQYRFRVEGHTDTVGNAASNKTLSERRARAVVNYISAKYGIPTGRMVAVGMGEEGQAVKTGDQVAEPKNRRVVVVNLGA